MKPIPSLLDQAEMLVPPFPWDRPRERSGGGEKVVLLHGFWRGFRAMQPLARQLQAAGYSTLNLPYPSGRAPIDTIVPALQKQIARFGDGGPVHLVTHSLGGILARIMLRQETPWRPGRLVMIAPPSSGSEIVDWLEQRKWLFPILGPTGRTLGTRGLPPTLGAIPAGVECAVIMGNRRRIPFFGKILADRNDGIVSVDHGRVEGIRGFSVVDADHTFIQTHPDTVRQTLAFLRDGKLAPA